jgi:hypothetical protein
MDSKVPIYWALADFCYNNSKLRVYKCRCGTLVDDSYVKQEAGDTKITRSREELRNRACYRHIIDADVLLMSLRDR